HWLILLFRFIYGFRTVTPFVMGMSPLSRKIYFPLSVVGALVWAIVVGTGGYLFGNFLEIMIGKIKHYEMEIMGAIALAGALAWAFHFYRQKRKKAAGPSSLTKII
ncbi:MAG: DedA family protein, partial [Deltaproteobacteria bacterium]|nr:DedA family protein [Deltaproteobacteria bacterium]